MPDNVRLALDRIFDQLDEDECPDLATLLLLRRQGACRDSTAAFYPRRGQSAAAAKEVCRSCGVRPQCLAYAIEHREWWGIWGGLAEKERRALNLLAVRGVPVERVAAMAVAGDLDAAMAKRRSTSRRASEQRRAS